MDGFLASLSDIYPHRRANAALPIVRIASVIANGAADVHIGSVTVISTERPQPPP